MTSLPCLLIYPYFIAKFPIPITAKPSQKLLAASYCTGIISVPKDLYLLELLNQGHFHLINENVSEQMSNFDISNSPIKTYSLEELKEMESMGISVNAYANALEQIKSSEKVLKYSVSDNEKNYKIIYQNFNDEDTKFGEIPGYGIIIKKSI